MTIDTDTSPFNITGDPEKISDLLDYLRQAYEKYVNTQILHGEPLGYVDAFMGVHNFHRLVVDDLIERTGNELLAQAAVDTFALGMLHREKITITHPYKPKRGDITGQPLDDGGFDEE